MILSRCCREAVEVRESCETAYYECSKCGLATVPTSVIVWADVIEMDSLRAEA